MLDVALQAELIARLALAAGLGAVVGAERELHHHPAGMRTHLLVAMGSAMFAIVSAYGYADIMASNTGALNDPQRIAAQVVSGIGFLGAGAIIQSGRWVHGLTTAASLWATAAIGLAVGAGDYVLGVAGTGLVALSLGPLNALLRRIRGRAPRVVRLRVELTSLDALGKVTDGIVSSGSEVTSVETLRFRTGRYEAELSLRVPAHVTTAELVLGLGGIGDLELSDAGDEAA